jgi:hypothetical protein
LRSRSPSPVNRNRPRGRAADGSDDSGESGDDDDDDNDNNNNNNNDDNQSGQTRRRAMRDAHRRRLAEGGLNIDERPTPGRLRNPSKYTDKSMYTNLDRSEAVGNARRRMANGMPREVNAICTNRFGKVRMCKRLLTPMNFRRLYLRLDHKIPRNLLMALTVDVSDNRLRTLDKNDVTKYYYLAARYLRSSISDSDDEILNSDLAVSWLTNAIQVLEGLHLCVGNLLVVQAIDAKFNRALDVRPGTLGSTIRRTLAPYEGAFNRTQAIDMLRNLADIVKPTDIRLWGVDDDNLVDDPNVPKYTPNVLLAEARTNEVRVYPLKEKKSYIRQVDLDD